MEIANRIKHKVEQEYRPEHMELLNESHMHAGPATESHFKLIVVSAAFNGLTAVKRHQMLYKLLADELVGPVHALALHLYTPEEWQTRAGIPDSPQCAGKNTA